MSSPSIRLYVMAPLATGDTISGSAEQAHYLAHVMRGAIGNGLRLFNGRDGEHIGRIASLTRKSVTFEILAQTRPQMPEPDCWLCFALLKRQKTDLVIEKATELGVSLIQPVITARTQADHVNLQRLIAIATEAAEQCERLAVPEIRPPLPLSTLIAQFPAGRRLFMADERRTAATARPAAGPTALLIGPEGGFTDAEVEGIGRQPLVTSISLGPRILRAETAAIAGLALLLASEPPQE